MVEPEQTRSSAADRAAPLRFVRFGPFQVDWKRQELFKHGARMRLQGKAFQVLLTLLERPGDVVTRDELRSRLWPLDTNVNFDANVNTTVNKLRQALGDSSVEPLYIETVPRRGYSFVAQTERTDEPVVQAARKADPGAGSLPAQAPGVEAVAQTSPAAGHNSNSIWVPIGVIAPVIAGMLLGAGIATIWIFHFGHSPGLR